MNRTWEYILKAIGEGQSSLEESDLVDGKFDSATGLFTDSKGKTIGPADKGYDNLYKGIQKDGSFRTPELYKPKHSFIAEKQKVLQMHH